MAVPTRDNIADWLGLLNDEEFSHVSTVVQKICEVKGFDMSILGDFHVVYVYYLPQFSVYETVPDDDVNDDFRLGKVGRAKVRVSATAIGEMMSVEMSTGRVSVKREFLPSVPKKDCLQALLGDIMKRAQFRLPKQVKILTDVGFKVEFGAFIAKVDDEKAYRQIVGCCTFKWGKADEPLRSVLFDGREDDQKNLGFSEWVIAPRISFVGNIKIATANPLDRPPDVH